MVGTVLGNWVLVDASLIRLATPAGYVASCEGPSSHHTKAILRACAISNLI